jgi:heme-degrading monooxygenase HmoA
MIARISRGNWGQDRDTALHDARERLLPALQARDGYRGLMVVEDAAAAEIILTTYWSTAAEMSAAEAEVAVLCAQVLGAGDPQVDHHLVAVSVGAHAATEGSWVRVLDATVDNDRMATAIAHFRERVVGVLGRTPGFLSGALFADPTRTRTMVATAWDTGEHMLLSASRLAPLREESREFGMRIRRVWNARLLLADLPAGVPATT